MTHPRTGPLSVISTAAPLPEPDVAEGVGPHAQDQSRRPVSAAWLTGGMALGYVVVFGVIALFRVHQVGKPLTFDVGNYQYYSGFAEIHGFGSPTALPGQLETYLDAQLNVVYYLLITHLPPRLAVSAIAFGQSLSVAALAWFVWRLARGATTSRLVPPLTGLLAGAGALLAPIYIGTTGQTGSDGLLALPLFVAVALLYQVLVSPQAERIAWRNTVVAGLLLGLTGELKFTEATYSAAIFAGFAVAVLLARSRAAWAYRRCLILVGTVGLTALVVAVALYLPEALMLWRRYHDPFFPFFNGIFNSRYLMPHSYNLGYAAHTPASVWFHFSRLLVGGQNSHNGMFTAPVESPVLFFGLVGTAAMLVVDVIRRNRPEAVLIEISVLLGFALWDVLFGFYRYLAPIQMAATAVVIVLLFLHRELYHPAVLIVVACALAVGTAYTQPVRLGVRDEFGTSYFAVPPNAFRDLRGAGVVFVGGAPLGFLVPDLPPGTDVVRAGGNLEQVMDTTWWEHVAGIVDSIHRPWWVVFDAAEITAVPRGLRQVGLPGSFHGCRGVATDVVVIRVCRVTA
jgi:hypothetical protein